MMSVILCTDLDGTRSLLFITELGVSVSYAWALQKRFNAVNNVTIYNLL